MASKPALKKEYENIENSKFILEKLKNQFKTVQGSGDDTLQISQKLFKT